MFNGGIDEGSEKVKKGNVARGMRGWQTLSDTCDTMAAESGGALPWIHQVCRVGKADVMDAN